MALTRGKSVKHFNEGYMQKKEVQPINNDIDADFIRQACNNQNRPDSGKTMPETEEETTPMHRRPIAARGQGWAKALSSVLARCAITPNQISVLSVVFAGAGAAVLVWKPTLVGFFACAACVQLRLLCNLLDGMVAVEGGKQTPTGTLYNEFPDRIADSLLLVGLGTAAGQSWLGWLGALLAALTAYVRVTGGSLGLRQDFRGPMAKQHRMAVLTVACVVAAGLDLRAYQSAGPILEAAAWTIAVGCLLTCVARTLAIARLLKGG